MAMRSDAGVAVLSYVTRELIGDITTIKNRFNEATRENEYIEEMVKDPVMVFFPTRASVAMPAKEAQRLGYLEVPQILNFEAVKDAETIAGKFKFAINDEERRKFWKMMEDSVIANCVARSGYTVPATVTVSKRSLHLNEKELVE